jgi:hypothetical protein
MQRREGGTNEEAENNENDDPQRSKPRQRLHDPTQGWQVGEIDAQDDEQGRARCWLCPVLFYFIPHFMY